MTYQAPRLPPTPYIAPPQPYCAPATRERLWLWIVGGMSVMADSWRERMPRRNSPRR